MLKKINRETAFIQYPKFPWYEMNPDDTPDNFFFPKVYNSYTLTPEQKTTRELIKNLSTELRQLIRDLGFKSLIFLSDNKRPFYAFYGHVKDVKPVIRAIEYLQASNIGKRFNGAIVVDTSELKKFITHIYWLTLTNAAGGDIHFMDDRQNIVGHIHYSGDILISTLNKQTDRRLIHLMKTGYFRTD